MLKHFGQKVSTNRTGSAQKKFTTAKTQFCNFSKEDKMNFVENHFFKNHKDDQKI
jgi:hypothetical protein